MGNNESAAFAVCGEPWKGGRGLPPGVYVSDGENLTLVPQRATACVSNMAADGFRQRYGRFLYGHGRPGKWERGAVVRIVRELSVWFESLARTGNHPTLCRESLDRCRMALKACAAK